MALTSSVLSRDGLALVPEVPDPNVLVELARLSCNQGLLGTPLGEKDVAERFLEGLGMELWATPMLVCRSNRAVEGFLFNARTDVGSLNTCLVGLLRDPVANTGALQLYVRHLFWSYPLHRVHAEIPAFAEAWLAALELTGFRREGRFVEHVSLGGRRHDAAALGLLRRDFDAWARAEAPDLELGAAS